MKETIDKLHFVKIKCFCSVKDNNRKMRRQAIDQEKIFAKTYDEELYIYKIYKEILILNNKKTIGLKSGQKSEQTLHPRR